MTDQQGINHKKKRNLEQDTGKPSILHPAVRDGYDLIKYGGGAVIISGLLDSSFPNINFPVIPLITYSIVLAIIEKIFKERIPARSPIQQATFLPLSWAGIISVICFYVGLMGVIFSTFDSAETWFSSADWLFWFPSVSMFLMVIGIVYFLLTIIPRPEKSYYRLLGILFSLGPPLYLALKLSGGLINTWLITVPLLFFGYFGTCAFIVGIGVLFFYWNRKPIIQN